jgi:GTP-binding protein Era
MLITHQHPLNKSLVVGLLGSPNVGKSSLINTLLGMDLSVVTDFPQTTRNSFHCILHVDHTEIVLVDTPGVHASQKEMNLRMNFQAQEGNEGTDIILAIFDLSRHLNTQFDMMKKTFAHLQGEIWCVFNKIDRAEESKVPEAEKIFKEWQTQMSTLSPNHQLKMTKVFFISALEGENIHELIGALCDKAPSAPHLYPGGEVTDKNERFFAAEYIREQSFLLLKEELPYELAVVIDEFRDLPRRHNEVEQREKAEEDKGPQELPLPLKGMDKLYCYISATILVNRPSQKAIVIGSKGQMIREIGFLARKKIEAMVGGPVHLNLHVKVSPKWFSNNFVLEELGLHRAPQSKRVWRKS